MKTRQLLTTLLLIVPIAQTAAQDAPSLRDRFRTADRNGDGKLTAQELPRPLLFKRLDRNGDGLVTLDEVQRGALNPPQDRAGTAIELKRNVSYGEHRAQRLDIHLPGKQVEQAPVMVYVHGGGWRKGDKAAVGQKAEHFTTAGWILVSVNYRLLPEGKHPRNVQDIAAALAWVHDHIAEYGGDPNAMFLMGHSAGCHLVSLVATDGRRLEQAGKSLETVKGVIALDTQAYDVPKLTQQTGSQTYINVFGNDTEAQRDASPMHHIEPDKGIPPFLIAYSSGLTGRINPKRAAFANAFATALRQAGVPAEVIDASDRNHGQINQRFGDPADKKVTGKAMSFLEALRTKQDDGATR